MDIFSRVLVRADGDRVLAGIMLGWGLIRGDATAHKAGYTAPDAARVATDAYGLDARERAAVEQALVAAARAVDGVGPPVRVRRASRMEGRLARVCRELGLEAEDLDEIVYEAVAFLASRANNDGVHGQLALLVQAWGAERTEARVRELARGLREEEGATC